MTSLPDEIPLADVPPTLRRPTDGDTVRRLDVLRRVGDTHHLLAKTGRRIAEWCDPVVVGLVAKVGHGRIASIGHGSAFAVALAAIYYDGRTQLSRAGLDDFLSVADLLGEELGYPCGEGLLATSGHLEVLVRSEHLEAVRDVLRDEYQRAIGGSSDQAVIAAAAKAANSGVLAVNAALHNFDARKCGLRVESNLLPVVRRTRDEFVATWPDEVVEPVEVYGQQIAVALEACDDSAEWLSVATLASSGCRGGESRPRRSEITEHFQSALQMIVPAAIGKTGRAVTILEPGMVEVLGLSVDMYPDITDVRRRCQADDATRTAIEVVHRANELLIARGLPPFHPRYGLSYAFRHRNALLPAEVLGPHDTAIAVNAMLTHSLEKNADDSYDKPSYSAYAHGLAGLFSQIDALTIDPALGPPVATPRPWKELKRSRNTHLLPQPDLWPLVRAVFEDLDLLGVFYGLICPPGSWELLAHVEVVDLEGRPSLRGKGLSQGHPVPRHVIDAMKAFIRRRHRESTLRAPRSLERLVLETGERRLEARFRDRGVAWPGPILSANLFRQLRGQVVDGLGLSPGLRRAILGRSATSVPHYVPASLEVVRLLGQSMGPLVEALRRELATNPVALRHQPRLL